jgi:hypothetical protein
MPMYTPGVGEGLVLAKGIRVTVLAVEGDEVLVGISTPEETRSADAGSRSHDAALKGAVPRADNYSQATVRAALRRARPGHDPTPAPAGPSPPAGLLRFLRGRSWTPSRGW